MFNFTPIGFVAFSDSEISPCFCDCMLHCVRKLPARNTTIKQAVIKCGGVGRYQNSGKSSTRAISATSNNHWFKHNPVLLKMSLCKFSLTPMGVLTPRSAHARPSAQPSINMSGNFPAHMSAESPSNLENLEKP